VIAPIRIIAKVATRLAGAMQLVQVPIIAGTSYMVTAFLVLAAYKLNGHALVRVNTSQK
jgi:hypothetical protein